MKTREAISLVRLRTILLIFRSSLFALADVIENLWMAQVKIIEQTAIVILFFE